MNTLRIANISGFYGDRLSAAREMIEGGPVDFLTGDYLAELTMAILYKAQAKRPEAGYAITFLKQMEQIMGPCLDRKIRIVVNAGGLNPAGLYTALQTVASELKVHPRIAYIEGDNLMSRMVDLRDDGADLSHIDTGESLHECGMMPVSANAYLGCWGIVEALDRGADIVVTGRVADTSVVMGPAAHYFGWAKDDWDCLAGAATAGHIIECSGQATGGNYSYFKEVPTYSKVGFPIAEIRADGSSVITKHPGTGGVVNAGTVTAQLMYEINAPEYITPDVVAHFDTIQLEDLANDQVQVSGVKGSPATDTSKVTVNCMGGFQNSMTFLIAGLDIEEKVDILRQSILEQYGGEEAFEKILFQYFPTNKDDPRSNEEALAQLKISVVDSDPSKAGKFFTSKLVELALCMVPGVCWSGPPGPAKPRIVHFPALLDKQYLQQKVTMNGEIFMIPETVYDGPMVNINKSIEIHDFDSTDQSLVRTHLGRLYAARSGDKGGNANLGVWGKNAESYAYLKHFLTVEKLTELLPDTVGYEILRYEFPNVFGLNFCLIGFLGDGVAASTKIDGQAKSLGEYLRAKIIEVPRSFLLDETYILSE